mgnify:FL=1
MPGAPGLRFFGLGPNLLPCRGLLKLQQFLNKNTFWAKNREINNLKKCLAQSDVVVSLWLGKEMIGFGRALTDGVYRGVLWDIVIDERLQGKGYGKIVVNALLNSKEMKRVKKIYLMTTNKKDFYCQLDFEDVDSQDLLIKKLSD